LARRELELKKIIDEEGLDSEATRTFIESAFRDGGIQPTGTAVTKILPPVSRFAASGAHAVKKQTVLEKLSAFFERFIGLS
jgi:type I restriction enzyme R subunit